MSYYKGIIRPVPPIQSGSLKGLLGIPAPVCHLYISRLFEYFEPKQKYREGSQKESIIERRIEKIIRRLFRRGEIPLFTKEESDKSNEALFFSVEIRINLFPEGTISYSVGMRFIQEVLLVRDPTTKIEAVTWGFGPVTCYSHKHEPDEEDQIECILENIVQTQIREAVNSFISSYRYDNESEKEKQFKSDMSYDTGPLAVD